MLWSHCVLKPRKVSETHFHKYFQYLLGLFRRSRQFEVSKAVYFRVEGHAASVLPVGAVFELLRNAQRLHLLSVERLQSGPGASVGRSGGHALHALSIPLAD